VSLTVRLVQPQIRAAGGATPCAANGVRILSAFLEHVANGFVPEGPLVSGTSRAGFQGAKN